MHLCYGPVARAKTGLGIKLLMLRDADGNRRLKIRRIRSMPRDVPHQAAIKAGA